MNGIYKYLLYLCIYINIIHTILNLMLHIQTQISMGGKDQTRLRIEKMEAEREERRVQMQRVSLYDSHVFIYLHPSIFEWF